MQSHCFWFVFVIGWSPWCIALKELDFQIYQLQILLSFVSLRKIFKDQHGSVTSTYRASLFFNPFHNCLTCKLALSFVVPMERLVKCALPLASTFTTAEFSSA